MTRRLLAAMSGWGKSYHAQAIMEASIPAFDYFALLDFKDEYRGLVKAGLASHFIVGGRELKWSVGTWRQFFEMNPKVVLARYELSTEQWQTVAGRVVQAIRSLAPQADDGALVAIDEAHFVAPQKGAVPDPITGLATTGRGEGASSLWITQRLALLEETVAAQCDEKLIGGFESKNDRNKIDPEYPADLHNPAAGKVPHCPEELQPVDASGSKAKGGLVPALRKFKDEDGNTIGSEWIYSNDSGERERRDTTDMEMKTTHYGPEGHAIQDPTYT